MDRERGRSVRLGASSMTLIEFCWGGRVLLAMTVGDT